MNNNQKNNRLNVPFIRTWAIAGLSIAAAAFFVSTGVWAQTYIEPPALSPSGRTATFLDTTGTTQRKLGSLFVGDTSGGDVLCLNALNSGDASRCISTWADLSSVVGGPFIRTNSAQTIVNPTLPASYNAYRQVGYSHLRGDGVIAQPTFVTTANYTVGTSTGLFASDEGWPTSFAAYFSGRVFVDRQIDLAGPPGPLGQICLNGTLPLVPAGPTPRYGCIQNWSDIAGGAIGAYVKVQSTNPPSENQIESAWVDRVWQFGSLTTTEVRTGQIANTYCSDGLCSPQVGETAITCPIATGGDC